MRTCVVTASVVLALTVDMPLLAACGGESQGGASTQPTAATRALRLPTLAEGEKCPVSPQRSVSPAFGPALGEGPVYPVGIPDGLLQFIYPPVKTQLWYPTDWGGQKVLWVADPSYDGAILIRGGRIDAPGRLGFGGESQPEWALSFGPGGGLGAWRQFATYTRLKAPGCYAYQVDGEGFRTIIVFEAAVFS
jgi:hypothetical protein